MTTTTHTSSAPPSAGRTWAGRIITSLVVAFLAFDGVTKIIPIQPVLEASAQLGLAARLLPGIGILLLICTAIYVFPSTAVLGAILLTGYLGGATAIHVRAALGVFPVVFAVAFGTLVWAGLILREPRLLRWILQRQ
jgi:DMSO/TMAO reductase YedYZ heme-binding membrane subunit